MQEFKNSEARRKANRKYLDNHYKKITVNLNKNLAEQFDSYCKELNKTKNSVLVDYIKELLQERLKGG